MNEKDMMQMKETITMPSELADTLLQNCSRSHRRHYRYSRYSKICASLAAVFCIAAVGSTSYAAYNVYQEKQLAVFMDEDLTQEEIAALGDELAQMPEIASCTYISGDEAWEDFQSRFLSKDLADAFYENPLKDSFNYEVSIRMGADTQDTRDKVNRLDGVRLVTTVRELNAGEPIKEWVTDAETGEQVEVWITTTEFDGVRYVLFSDEEPSKPVIYITEDY